MERRDFLKTLGLGAVGTAAVVAGCDRQGRTVAEGFTPGEVPTDQMTYRTDAHGRRVSLLGFGMMRLPAEGGGTGSNRDRNNAPLDQEEINRLVDYALAHGVNYFDTAPVYCKGRSEEATGIALSRHPRSEYLVATKLSNFSNSTREASLRMYHESFEKLRVDHIDYYLLHSFGAEGDFKKRFLDNGMLDFLIAEREAGRIRNLGWSFHGIQPEFDQVVAMHDQVHWDFAQIQMNYVDWHFAHEIEEENLNAEYLYNELASRSIPIVIMEPVLGGRLATLNEHAARLLKEREPNRSLASWAFRHLGTFPAIMTALSGMNRMEHLQDNIRSFAPLQPLNDDEMALLERIAEEFCHWPAVPCTACQYCMPCPFGLDIPGIFAHYNHCLNEGNVKSLPAAGASGDEQREFRRARKAFLTQYDSSIARLRQADHCIGCGECLKHCPQHIAIPTQMHKIEDYTNQLKDSLV